MHERVSRRGWFKTVGTAAAGAGLASLLPAPARGAVVQDGAGGAIAASLHAAIDDEGNYALPPLPYDYAALEPHMDAQTMMLHHDRHHAAYVRGANDALASLAGAREGQEISNATIEYYSAKLSFNLGGHLLHSIFWPSMAPDAGGEPEGTLADAVNQHFGSFDAFLSHFTAAASAVEGSGWGALVYESVSGKLMVVQIKNQNLLSVVGMVPLVLVDVWEHAYYLKYQNARADYIAAWWNTVNWPAVGQWYETMSSAHAH